MTVTFDKDYLQGKKSATGETQSPAVPRAATAVTIKYAATVTSDSSKFASNVNERTNDANITYTNKPGSTTDSDHVKTHHYTFGLDADIAGGSSTSGHSKELRKIAVDADGNIQYDTKENSWNDTKYNPLAGATFKLTANSSDNTAYEQTFTTDDTGKISFTGLDGDVVYTLEETAAPAGYQLDKTKHYIKIFPEYNTDGTLKSYEVRIADTAEVTKSSQLLSGFTITNDGQTQEITSVTEPSAGNTALFKNVKNPPLPTTGGAGTMALTAGGLILVIGGAYVLLRSRRREQQ